ncbi:DivIVA domain-containing protein [Trueperella bialowiezensis]|uniref:DivIVA domain repeat protein n=1 Tax=Trueperella bialowiezensis TaxID=312285 RepID=A0A3S5EVY9_9ACTO|nr:DivIVA domain-containing protein [Trueperella bialowiezensis]VEI12670.1 DivIVA domain repeat protein [Trueperella bialowiezensis]
MADTFERVDKGDYGYKAEQVEEFLERAKQAYGGDDSLGIDETSVRNIAFDWVRGGYDPKLVDAALDRLESAFVQQRRARVVDEEGEAAWLDRTYELAQSLYPRLMRPNGEKFADATGQGYAKKDVDALMARLADYFSGTQSLSSADLRLASFPTARGSQAYSEAVVDVFIDRAVSVLLAVE